MPNSTTPLDRYPLVRKLTRISALHADELAAVAALPMIVRELRPDEVICREGDCPSQCCLMLKGFSFRYKMVGGGRRQIFSFHIQGDIPDLQSLHLVPMDHDVAALSSAKVGFIQHRHLRDLCLRHPRVAAVLWRDTLIDGAIFREWMAGMGRRHAVARVAHLLCEMYVRLNEVGLAQGGSVAMPITQEEFGDALGLSTVHVNRSLQALRHRGLIQLAQSTLTIPDWSALKAMAEFDPTYLHLDPRTEGEA